MGLAHRSGVTPTDWPSRHRAHRSADRRTPSETRRQQSVAPRRSVGRRPGDGGRARSLLSPCFSETALCAACASQVRRCRTTEASGDARSAPSAAVAESDAATRSCALARSSGQRLGHEGSPTCGAPDDVAVVLAQARALIAVDVRAQGLYAQVLEERSDHPEALAYSGFLLFDVSAGASDGLRQTALSAVRDQRARAVEADAQYRGSALLPGGDRGRRWRRRRRQRRAGSVLRARSAGPAVHRRD